MENTGVCYLKCLLRLTQAFYFLYLQCREESVIPSLTNRISGHVGPWWRKKLITFIQYIIIQKQREKLYEILIVLVNSSTFLYSVAIIFDHLFNVSLAVNDGQGTADVISDVIINQLFKNRLSAELAMC